MLRALKIGLILIAFQNGFLYSYAQEASNNFQTTDVTFTTANHRLQKLFDLAEKKVQINIRQYTDEYKVMVEGAVYPFVFLETQPMAGGMYAKRDLSFLDEKTKDWTIEPGKFEIQIGSSSQDIKSKKIIEVL